MGEKKRKVAPQEKDIYQLQYKYIMRLLWCLGSLSYSQSVWRHTTRWKVQA